MHSGKRLQHYANRSWLLSGAVSLIASLCLFFLFGYFNYFRDLKYLQSDLDNKVQIAARRISGELLIAPRGSPDAVARQVAKDLQLSEVTYGSPELIRNSARSGTQLYSISAVPFLEETYQVLISTPKAPMLSYFNFSVLISCFGLIGFVVGTGLILQTRYLRRHLIHPIEALVDTSTGDLNVNANWPLELQEISRKLNHSFQDRERVIFSKIAKGVVHDIKTILQAFKVATDLAIESPTEARLNNLLKVSQNKLPSLLALIDMTLDGSREIFVTPQSSSIIQTINRSIENVRSLPIATKASIGVAKTDDKLQIAHDPIQLERVFTNLFKNGLEAIDSSSADHGLLKISFQTTDKNFLSVLVEDSGIGLPRHTESVFRILKSTKPHGSGLGLLVSRKIVEAHKGQLLAGHSQKLNGARFEVLLPRGTSL